MQTLNTAELAFLSIITHYRLTEKALQLYAEKTTLFTTVFCPHLYKMWAAYLNILTKAKKQGETIRTLSKDLIAAGISEEMQRDDHMPAEMLAKCDTILQRLISGDSPSEDDGFKLLHKMVQLDVNRKISAQVTMNADILELQQTLDISKRAMSGLVPQVNSTKDRIVYNPFKEMAELAVYAPRIPTGINWMDEVTSGGGREGELWLILGSSGGGKCLGKDTPILMYDGHIKKVQDVVVGDLLMGPDSTPRTVLSLGRGRSPMYKITQTSGDPYIVNDQHILTLAVNRSAGFMYKGHNYPKDSLIDMPVRDYMALPMTSKSYIKGVHARVDFPEIQEPTLDPYFLGLVLGEHYGSHRFSCIKHFDSTGYCYVCDSLQSYPISQNDFEAIDSFVKSKRGGCFSLDDVYKLGSAKTRAAVLAGLLDNTIENLCGSGFDAHIFDKALADDIVFIARSLGYSSYIRREVQVGVVNGHGYYCYIVYVSGNFDDLPCKIIQGVLSNRRRSRKRPCKRPYNKITVTELPVDDYYGFVIDGDHRFLLGDFTITHNTAIAVQYSCAQALMGNGTLWATYEQSLEGDVAERIISCVTDVSLDEIRDVGFNNLSEETQNKFWASVAGADEKLIVLDMTKLKLLTESDPSDNGGIYSVWQQYKKLKEQGHVIKTVIIDWFGAMMSLVGSVSNKDLSKGFRFFAQAEIDIARRFVKEEGVQIIFFHQTDSHSQHARPIYIPDKTCAKDMKDMCNYMDIVLTLGIRDVNNVCWFNAAKSRKGASIVKTIQLIGDKSRFVNAEGWLPNRDGNFYKPGSDDLTGAGTSGASAYSRELD